jgi:hypothetical protein
VALQARRRADHVLARVSRGATRRLLVLCVALAACAVATASLAPAATTRAGSRPQQATAARAPHLVPTSRDETGFGPFSESPRNDAHALRAAFGRVTSAHRHGRYNCVLRWRRLGITATVGTYGLVQKPCRNGYFFDALLTKRRWHTAKGVHPGSSEAAARRAALRPCGRYCGVKHGYVLGVHRSDCAAGLYPGVVAAVRRHRVTSLVVLTHGCE